MGFLYYLVLTGRIVANRSLDARLNMCQHIGFDVLQRVLVLGDLERLPFGLERGLRIRGHRASRTGHLILHGLGLVRSYGNISFVKYKCGLD